MDLLRSVSFLLGLVLWYPEAASSDMVMVRRGQPVVLQCEADPRETLILVTWKLHLYNSSCMISHKIEEDNTMRSYSTCSPRMKSDNLSLTISNTDISDEGTYRCEVAHGEGTSIRSTLLQVLVQPFTYLTLTSDGSPVCGAIGGNPPAEISWIPHSDDINTTKLQDQNRTWSVISTYRREKIDGMSVTCVVSHPTLESPWTRDITVRVYNFRFDNTLRIIVTVISTVLMAGLLLYLRKKRQEQNNEN